MKPLLAFAAIACALAACSGMGGPVSLPPPSGTEPTNGAGATEPTGGGAEPGVSGTDPPPGGGGDSVAQLCTQFCNRAAAACGGAGDPAECAASCTDEVSASGACLPLYVDALHCLITQPLTCDGTYIMSPNCTYALLAASQCTSSTTSPPTAGGGTPNGA